MEEAQRAEAGLDEKRLRGLVAKTEKDCVCSEKEEAILARDYIIWRKLTGLDNGIDFFHDYCGLPKDQK